MRLTMASPVLLQPAEFFVLRTPLLPIDTLLSPPDAPLDAERLQRVAARPVVRDALWLASRARTSDVAPWLNGKAHEERSVLTLLRYVTRMASRSTPFGLFAGSSVGRVGERAQWSLPPLASAKRVTYPDIHWLRRFVRGEGREDRGQSRVFGPNRTIHGNPAFIRYITEEHDAEQLDEVRTSDAIRAALDAARSGLTHQDLCQRLVGIAGPDVDEAAIAAFVDRLIACGVLVAQHDVCVTVNARGAWTAGEGTFSRDASRLRSLLRRADRRGPDGEWTSYEDVRCEIQRQLPEAAADLRLHADLLKPASPIMSRRVALELAQAAEQLAIMSERRNALALPGVVSIIRRHFGDKPVPLLDVLDDDIGIRRELDRNETLDARQREAAETDNWRDVVLPRFGARAALVGDELIVERESISEQDAARLLPEGLSISGSIGRRADGSDVMLLRYAFGPSASRLLTRHCRSDPRLRDWTRELIAREEQAFPDAICADVVYLPQTRAANTVVRPWLRRYEIVCRGSSAARPEHQLDLADLLVAVRGDRILLYSRRLARQIVPRCSVAFNTYRGQSTIFRFLCAVEEQDGAEALYWRWGPLGSLRRLPRVKIGSVVVCRAYWHLTRDLVPGTGREIDERQAIDRWRADEGVPRFIILAEEDRELFADLDQPLYVRMVADYVRRKGRAFVYEMLPAPDELCVTSPEGAFTNDIILPCVASSERRARTVDERRERLSAERAIDAATAAPCRYGIGSEWLYARLSIARRHVEVVLAEEVAPLLEALRAEGRIDAWYFVRYADPEPHVRLRCHGRAEDLHTTVLPTLEQRLADLESRGFARDHQWCVYEPEIARYGGAAGMRVAEQLFDADTAMCMELFGARDDTDAARWLWCLAAIDRTLEDFGLDLEARHDLVLSCRDAGYTPLTPVVRRQAAQTFRQSRLAIRETLARRHASGTLATALEKRSVRCRPLVHRLHELAMTQQLTCSVGAYLMSCVHMNVNRLLWPKRGSLETLLYDVLGLYYRGEIQQRASPARGVTPRLPRDDDARSPATRAGL